MVEYFAVFLLADILCALGFFVCVSEVSRLMTNSRTKCSGKGTAVG